MQRALDLELSPPLHAVLRFFLATPLFALLAALLLAWQGEAALQSRWSPATLALTHLFTLGALGMAMAGALIQILPVVAAAPLPRTRLLAPAVHALLGAGALTLAAAFLLGYPWLFRCALALLLTALLWLAAALTVGLWQPSPPGAAPMLGTVRLALAALLVTVALAAPLAAAFGWPGTASFSLTLVTDLHAAWGIFGWSGLLLAGVAFQVVPMFQVTPLYNYHMAQRLGVLVFLLLVLWSVTAVQLGGRPHWMRTFSSALIMASFAAFAVHTLHLLARRKRPDPDGMTWYWRLAMASLLACALLWALPERAGGSGRPLALGVLAIVGFLYSAITGMLYKIVPFLVWNHLQEQAADRGRKIPSVKQLLPDQSARRQFWLHCAALLLLLAACWWPQQLARPAALALVASAAWLWINLMGALRSGRVQRGLPCTA